MNVTCDGDLLPDQVRRIAQVLDVHERVVVEMNRRLARDYRLNPPAGPDRAGDWQSNLVDEADSQEIVLAAHEELAERRAMLPLAMRVLDPRERRSDC